MYSTDYSLNNPDTLTKYKTAAEISEKVLAAVKELCVAGEKISDICGKGDQLLEEEISKVWRGKKVSKGNQSLLPPNEALAALRLHVVPADTGVAQVLLTLPPSLPAPMSPLTPP